MTSKTTSQRLIKEASEVLALNDLGMSTRPTATLYPHQWLWDSCFIAIGLRHLNVERAKDEIRSLLKGQWRNGMIPYIIFGPAQTYHAGPSLWISQCSRHCPPDLQTSGGTQPPMIAEAVVRIGELLKPADRKAWYTEVYPALSAYHEWLYRDRDVDGSGLVVLFHPWETGLDNNPAWMDMVHIYALSNKLWLMSQSSALLKFLERYRKDTSVVPANERMSTLELMAFYDLVKHMRSHKYDDAVLRQKSKLLIQDVGMNSILVRATQQLGSIANVIGEKLPPLSAKAYERGTSVLDVLWDEASGLYYSRDCRSGQLIKQPAISGLLPLYAGKLGKAQREGLLRHLQEPLEFGADYPVPSTPLNSSYFKEHCYWQGPTWFNVNWLLIKGLEQNGQPVLAKQIGNGLINLVATHGMHEYFSPLDGTPAGAPNFSWTAALTIDLLKSDY